jgi:ceramide glucosyltransferase
MQPGGALLWLLSAAGCGFHLSSVFAMLRWRRSRAEEPQDLPPISVLKPICGVDPDQYHSFASFCRQNYPAYQLVFGALSPDDPGLHTVKQLQAQYPMVDIAVVTGGPEFGLNRKVCNLHQMLPAAKHDLLVLCDTDMRADPDYLRTVAAEVSEDGVGLVTCPYRGTDARTLPARLEALGISTDFFPGVFMAAWLQGVHFAFGSTIALQRAHLREIGGFDALKDDLADDYQLAFKTWQSGRRVVLSRYVIDDVLGDERLAPMLSRRLRWARTTRAMQPAGWFGAIITHPLPFAAAAMLAAPHWGLFSVVFTVRAVCAAALCLGMGAAGALRSLWLLPVSDLLNFGLWAASWMGRSVRWRGETFLVEKGGILRRPNR